MKLTHILALLAAALVFAGCSPKESASQKEASPTGSSESSMDEKTSYEGSTGSGLLMERYKSGRIEGYQD